MRQLENGDWELSDGRVVRADEIGKLHEKTKKPVDKDNPLNLAEGQCSGPVILED